MEIWTQRLMRLFADSHSTYRDISKVTGIPISALHRYITGTSNKIPLDRLEKLADFFNVKSEYLMGWDSDSDQIIRPKERVLFERSRALTDRQLDIVNSIVDEMVKEKNE